MNILHTETLKGWGGQQNKTLKELVSLKNLGHNTFLICNPNSQISKKAKEKGIIVFEQEMSKKNFHKTIPYFLNFIKTHNVNMMISHGSTDSWIVAISGNLSSRKPFIARERHNLFPINGAVSRFQHRVLFDKILTISQSVKQYLNQIGIKKEKCFMLPDIVNIKHFEKTKPTLRSEFNIPKDAIIVGVFTSLTKKKGVYDFFEVAKDILTKCENIYVVFGGDFSKNAKDKIELYFLQNNFDLNKIIWTGFRDDAAKIMKDFDVFLFPSHTEGLGTVIIEAMASKLPIIVWDIEPMNTLVQNNINGLCAPFNDTKELTKLTLQLIHNKPLRKEMGKKSFEKATDCFSEDILTNRLKDLVGESIVKHS